MTASETPEFDSGLYTLNETNEIEGQSSKLQVTASFSLPRVSKHIEDGLHATRSFSLPRVSSNFEGGLRKWGSNYQLNSNKESETKSSAKSPKKSSVLQNKPKTPGHVRFELPLQSKY